MTQEEEKISRAIRDMYNIVYWYWTRPSAIYLVAQLCTGKLTRQEASNVVLQLDREKAKEISEKMQLLNEDKEVLGFIKLHSIDFELETRPSETIQEKLDKHKRLKKVDIKIPLKDVYWVLRRLDKSRQDFQYKRYMYWTDTEPSNADLRKVFLRLTKYVEIRHRKKSKKYTVSRDEDKDEFYVSAKGRLAKLPLYKLKKYIKKGMIVKDHEEIRAKDEIPDGQYVKVGSYLQKYFPKVPKEIRERFQKAFEEIRPCHMVIDTDFEKAYNPIYNNHQDTDGDKASNYSCMSGEGSCAQKFYGGIHGCKVVRWETDKGDQVGRCIMYEYEGKRHFVRIYGIYDYHRTMINMLYNEMHPGDLFGREEQISGMVLDTDWVDETLTMYLDGPYGVRQSYDNEKHCNKYEVRASGWDFDCKSTSHGEVGYEGEEWYTCDNCGERVQSDDAYFIHDNVYCCCDCAQDAGWRCCEWCGEWEWEEDGEWVDDGDTWYCCSEHARRNGCEKCENCGEWHTKSDMIEIGDNYYCNEDCAEEDCWHRCKYCDDWVHEDDAEIVNDEAYCCVECAEKDGWERKDGEWQRVEDVEEVKEQEPETKELSNEG